VNTIALVHAIANSDLFSLFRNFHHSKWRNGVLQTRVYDYQIKGLQNHPKRIRLFEYFENNLTYKTFIKWNFTNLDVENFVRVKINPN
jgi:hypothetical protein